MESGTNLKNNVAICLHSSKVYSVVYRPVIWSGDELPHCDKCEACLYDKEFGEYHKTTETK